MTSTFWPHCLKHRFHLIMTSWLWPSVMAVITNLTSRPPWRAWRWPPCHKIIFSLSCCVLRTTMTVAKSLQLPQYLQFILRNTFPCNSYRCIPRSTALLWGACKFVKGKWKPQRTRLTNSSSLDLLGERRNAFECKPASKAAAALATAASTITTTNNEISFSILLKILPRPRGLKKTMVAY